MKELETSQGYKAQVDDADYERAVPFSWFVSVRYRRDGSVRTVYVYRYVIGSGRAHQKNQALHRFILGITDPRIKVDHIDHNGLNCQCANLRESTDKQNQGNKRMQINNTSGFKGVVWHKNWHRWASYIRIKGVLTYLGSFDNAPDAARAYDGAARAYFGEFALTNFPKSPDGD